jgi:hypothetical protein
MTVQGRHQAGRTGGRAGSGEEVRQHMMLFTREELERECRPLSSRALEASREGRLDQLRFLLGRMSSGHMELYLGYLHWIVRILGKIQCDLGDGFLEYLLAKVAEFLVAPYVAWGLEGDEKRTISSLVSLWVSQAGRIEPIGETHNEVAFRACPCGSGGRLILESWYERDPTRYARTARGEPVFCRLCEHLQAALNRGVGHTFWSVVPEVSRTGFCRMSFLKQAQRGKRLYTEGESYRLTTPRCRQALRLLDRGVLEIEGLLEDQHHEWRPLHDFLCLWVAGMFSVVYREKGPACVGELVRATYAPLFESAYVLHTLVDERTVFSDLVRNWYYHQASFEVVEEEDRFVFVLDPCGSGGRLWRGQMGPPGFFRYGEGLLCHIAETSEFTFQRAPFPIYCTHCAVTNKEQLLGRPWTFLVDGSAMAEPSSPCKQYLYKKGAARRAPESLLQQVGLDAARPLRKEYLL